MISICERRGQVPHEGIIHEYTLFRDAGIEQKINEKHWEKLMKVIKNAFVVALVLMAGAVFYYWGNLDGKTGRTFGITGEALAAGTSS